MDITQKWQRLNISTDHRNGNKMFSVSCCDYYTSLRLGFAELWTALIRNFNQVSPSPPPALRLIEANGGGICRYNRLEYQPSHSAHLPLMTVHFNNLNALPPNFLTWPASALPWPLKFS